MFYVSQSSSVEKSLTESYQAIERLSGVFLVTQGKERKPNIMTIGWMQGGIIWGRPIISVLVRPSRFHLFILRKTPPLRCVFRLIT